MKTPFKLIAAYPVSPKITINNAPRSEIVPPPDVLRIEKLLYERDYTENTRKAIRTDVRSFLKFFHQKNGYAFDFKKLTPRDIIDWRDDAAKEGRAPATINRRLIHVRLFLELAVEVGLLPENPAKSVKQLTLQKLAPRSLQPQELRQFLKEIELGRNKRDLLMITLMAEAGLRLSEVINLSVKDVGLMERKGTIAVMHSKHHKSRLVPLNKRCRELLTAYISECKPTDKLFTRERERNGTKLTPLTHIGAIKMIEKYAAKTGLHITAHNLRHSFAYAFMKQRPGDILALSAILGHSNVQQSARYAMNTLDDLQEKVEGLTMY